MFLKRAAFVTLIVFALAVSAAPTFAQDWEIVADGLRNPRNMSFDAAGNLYVAEAGISGSQRTSNDDPYGATGRVTMITPDGTASVMLDGFLSYGEGGIRGLQDVMVTDDSIWVLMGEVADLNIPYNQGLIELSHISHRPKTWVDLLEPELTSDPDGNPNQQSNPTDFDVAADGTIVIANAGCNCLMTWSPDAGLSIAAAWPHATDNPVPTSVAVGPDGDVYVGFLTGFPFPQGGARIERWSGGELKQTYTGLTMVTSLLVTADGTIYAVEYGVFEQGAGFKPGRVVMVGEDGTITPVMEGLMSPYGIAQAPDGSIVVSVDNTGADDGQILRVPAAM